MATNLIALDVGERRVGVALVRADVRVPVALPTLERQGTDFWQQLEALVHEYDLTTMIVGLPRGLNGQNTAQTETVQAFGEELTRRLGVAIVWQDEALTSRTAEQQLRDSGRPYEKGDIDARAAVLILEDYLAHEQPAHLTEGEA